MNRYSWTLNKNEYYCMKKCIYLKEQYTALVKYLDREKDIFNDPTKVALWRNQLQHELDTTTLNLEMEKNRFIRKFLRPFTGNNDFSFSYEFSTDLVVVESEADLQFPDEYLNRLPKLRIEEYSSIVTELFPELLKTNKVEDGELATVVHSVTFQVTDGCNLACTYCYQINKHNNFMTEETADKMIELVLCTEQTNPWFNPDNTAALILDFIGGEPFLAVDLIDHICTQFVKRLFETNSKYLPFFRFSTCSNGVLYSDPRVQAFMDKWNGLLSFSVTLDGNKELHDSCRVFPDGRGSFDLAHAAIEAHRAKGYRMGSKVTIAPGNVDKLYEAIMFMIDEKYTDIHANCVFEEGWTYDHARTYYYQMKKIADEFLERGLDKNIIFALFSYDRYRPMNPENNNNWCGGTGSMLAVDYKGDIYPCLRYMESSLGDDQKPIKVGHTDRGIVTTDEERQTMECMRCITRRSQSTDECFNCPIAEGCAWCSAHNYQATGSVNKRATFICPMHKAEALANYYYWNKLFIKEPHNHIVVDIHIPEEWALQVIDREEWEMIKSIYKEASDLC